MLWFKWDDVLVVSSIWILWIQLNILHYERAQRLWRLGSRMLCFEWDGAPGVSGIWILTLHWLHCLERFGRYSLIGGSISLEVDFESLKIYTIPNLLSLPPSQSSKCNLPATMLDVSFQASQPKKTSIFLEP